jgi:hypothetical protein
MARLVRHHPALFSIAVLFLAIPLVLRLTSSAVAAKALVAPADLEVALIRAGLDPDALAAAGLNANQTTSAVGAFKAAMNLEPTRLANADAAYAAARVSSDSLRRLIQSGKGTSEDVTSYQQAMSALDLAEADRKEALNDWFVAAVAGLPAAQVTALVTIDDNRDWDLDLEMLAVDRTEPEWVELRDALTHERVAAKYNEPVASAVAAYLAICRSDPAVAAAKTGMTTNGPLVAAAFEAALQ